MRYCMSCDRNVQPRKGDFNWAIFFLLCLTGIGGIIYILYYLICKRKNKCPICGCKTKRRKKVIKELTPASN